MYLSTMFPINQGLKGPGMDNNKTETMEIAKYLRYGFAKNNKRLKSFFLDGLTGFIFSNKITLNQRELNPFQALSPLK